MNLISQIFFAILITSATGTIALGCWKAAKKLCLAWSPDVVHLTLKLVGVLYLIPFSYILMQSIRRDGYIRVDGIWQMNFSLNGIMWMLGMIAEGFWIYLTGRSILRYLLGARRQRYIYGGNIPEEDDTAIEEFERIKKKLNIQRKIRLYRNDVVDSPMIQGVLFPTIILPFRDYDREQLSVIFHHELMHYKGSDVFFKTCAWFVSIFQHLNPISGNLLELLEEWCEFQCDVRVITKISDELSATRYFEVIVETMGNNPIKADGYYTFSMLSETQLRLERRIEYMKKYNQVKKQAKAFTVLGAVVFVLMSVTTTYAATSKVADVHDYLYKNVEVTTDVTDTVEETELEESYLPAALDDTYDELVYANPELEIISPILDANVIQSFSWSVAPGTRTVTNTFYVSSGQHISVAAVATPSTTTYWIGIMDKWNNVYYVEGTSSLSHVFTANSSGNYRVLVQNRGSSGNLSAYGNYYYY